MSITFILSLVVAIILAFVLFKFLEGIGLYSLLGVLAVILIVLLVLEV